MSTLFTFLSNNTYINLYAPDDAPSQVTVTSWRLKPNSDTHYDEQTFNVPVTDNTVIFNLPYQSDSSYDRYCTRIDTEVSVIPFRDSKSKIDVNRFHVNTVLSLIEAEIETLRKFNFYKCVNLKKVKASKMESDISNAFFNCKHLETADMGIYDAEDMNFNFQYLFHKCENLTRFSYGIGENVYENKIYVGTTNNLNYTFYGCKSIQQIELVADTVDHVHLRSTFDNCLSLNKLTLPQVFSKSSCITDSANMCFKCESLKTIEGLLNTKLNLLNAKDVSHMFAECKQLESAPIIDVKSSNDLQRVRAVGIFNNCKKMNRVSITSDSDDYEAILATELLHDETTGEELVEDRDILVVAFSEPNRPYSMRNSFCDQKRELFLYNFKGGNMSDSSYMFHGCKDVYVNKRLWQLETGFGKYGLSDEYEVKYTELKVSYVEGEPGVRIEIDNFPLGDFEILADIIDIVEVNDDYLPVGASKVYHRTDTDDAENTPCAVARYEQGFLYIYPLFKGIDNTKKLSFVLNYVDEYELAAVEDDFYAHFNSVELYDESNDLFRGNISSIGKMIDDVPFTHENMNIVLDLNEEKNIAIVPYVKLVDVNPEELSPVISTNNLELLSLESDVDIVEISDVERDLRLITKRIEYDKDSYIGYNSTLIGEVRINKPNGDHISKYFKLFKPSYSAGEGFTPSTTILDQDGDFETLKNRRYSFIEYRVFSKNEGDLLTTLAPNSAGTPSYNYYLPFIYDDNGHPSRDYSKVEIFKKDGSVTSNIDTLVEEVDRIRLWYPENTTKVKFSSGDTGHESAVTSIDYINVDNFTDMSSLFRNLIYLREVNMTDWNINPNVTDMSYLFYNCHSLENIDLAGSNTNNVTDMSYMFSGCSSLTELDLSTLNTGSVTNMGHMFDGCSSLVELNLSTLNTSNVTNMGYIFSGCSSLTELDLSTFNTSNVTSMGYMFNGCTNLKDVNMSNWKYDSSGSSPASMFYKSSIENLIIDNSDFSKSTTSYKNYVSSIPELKTLSAKNVIFGATCTGFFRGIKNQVTIDADNCDLTLLTDMSYLFSGSTGLTDLDLNSWKTGTAEDISYLVSDCTGLENLNISSWDTHNIKNMSNMFSNTPKLKDVDLSNWEYDSNTTLPADIFVNSSIENLIIDGNDFSRSTTNYSNYVSAITNLKTLSAKNVIFGATCVGFFRDITNNISLDVSGSDVTLLTDMSYLFNGSTGLTELDLSTWDTVNTVNMSYIFGGCTGLTELDLSTWDISNTITMDRMFENTTGLKDVNIANWKYDSNTTLPADMYADCYVENLIIDNSDFARSDISYAYYVSSVPHLKTLSAKNVIFGACCSGFFRDITNVITLELTGGDVTLLTDMSYLFAGSSGLSELDLSTWDTVNTTNMSHMFDGCTGLGVLDVSQLNVTNVTDISSMFSNCTGLAELDLSTWNISNIENMNQLFYNTPNLKDVNMSNWKYDSNTTLPVDLFTNSYIENLIIDSSDFSKSDTPYAYYVSSIPHLKTLSAKNVIFGATCNQFFRDITNSVTIDVSGSDVTLLTDMSYLFAGSSGITELNLSSWDTTNVTDMSHIFEGCTSLAILDISGWVFKNVTDISYMFSDCLLLESLNLSSWETENIIYMSHVFNNTPKLKDVNLANWKYDSNTTIPADFLANCYIENLIIDNSDFSKSSTLYAYYASSAQNLKTLSAKNVIFGASCNQFFRDITNSVTIDVSGSDVTLLTDMSYMFSGSSGLTELDITTWDTSHVIDMNHMFSDCSGLTTLDLSTWDVENVLDMSYMFSGCSSLLEMDVSALLVMKVRDVSHMFENCSSLSNVILFDSYNWTTFYIQDASYMFKGCSSLTDISFPFKGETNHWHWFKNLKTASHMFDGCSSLEYISLNWDEAKDIEDTSYMFYNCINLIDANLGLSFFPIDAEEGVDMNHMFANCEKLLKSPYGMSLTEGYDMSYLFYNCKSLTSVHSVSRSFERAINIDYIFSGCTSLEEIAIPCKNPELEFQRAKSSKVKYMSHIFDGCTNLKNVIMRWEYDSNTTNVEDIFANCYIENLDITYSDFSRSKDASYSYFVKQFPYLKELDANHVKFGPTCNQFFRDASDILLSVIQCNVTNLPDMSYMFSGCRGLKKPYEYDLNQSWTYGLDITTWLGTSSVTDMSYMFSDSRISSINLSTWNTVNVQKLDRIFNNADILKDANLSNWKYKSNTTNAVDIFANSYIENLNIDNSDFTGSPALYAYYVSSMPYIEHLSAENVIFNATCNQFFRDITNEIELELSGSKFSEVCDGSYMFSGSSGITGTIDLKCWEDGELLTDMAYMFYGCSNITNLIMYIECTGTSTSHMFDGCVSLTDITNMEVTTNNTKYLTYFSLPNVEDMSYMFYNCSSLNAIWAYGFSTSKAKNASYMFYGCSSLTAFSNYDSDNGRISMGNLENASHMAYGCSSLKTFAIDISGGTVTNASYMFYGCISAETTLDTVVAADGADMSHMYEGCTSLTRTYNSGVVSGDISDASYMFANCTSLVTAFGVTGSPHNLEYMFYNCTSLTTVECDKTGTANLTNVDHMFYNCTSLTTIDLSTWDTGNITNSTNMFKYVSPTVNWLYDGTNYIDWTLTERETSFSGAFPWNINPTYYMTYTITSSVLGRLNEQTDDGQFKYFPKNYYYEDEERTSKISSNFRYNKVEITMSDGTKTSDLNSLVKNVSSITVWFPSDTIALKFEGNTSFAPGIKTIDYVYSNNFEDCSRMFYNCISLTSLCSFNTSNVTDMSYMFYQCANLNQNIYDFTSTVDTSKVTDMSYMFFKCTSITETKDYQQITLQEWDTRSLVKASAMFAYCSHLIKIDLSTWDTSQLIDTSYMFFGCSKLHGTAGTGDWTTPKLVNASYMFCNCRNIDSVNLCDWNTSQLTNVSHMLYGCTGLDYLTLYTWDTSSIQDSSNMLVGVPTSVNWNYWSGDDRYANWTLTETQTGYSGTFPWNDERS